MTQSLLKIEGEQPKPRFSTTIDIIGDILHVFGGFYEGKNLNDTWRLDLS